MPFQKGQSGNPGGQPKALVKLQDLARSKTEAMLNTLIAIAEDKDASPSARVAACNAILDRGWGKPTQAIEHSGDIPISGIEVVLVDTGVRRDNPATCQEKPK